MRAAKLMALRSLCAIAGGLMLYGPGTVAAAEPADVDAQLGAVPESVSSDVVSFGTPVTAAVLAQERGGAEVTNTNDVVGEVTNNTAHNVATGANTIQGGSFANASGITTVVQNTGANVLIQSATIVNVQFSAP